MRRPWHRAAARPLAEEDGLAAVELALALPVLALLLVGLVDVGTVAFQQMQLTAAGRAGAELGLIGSPTSERLAAVRAAVEAAAPPAPSGTRELQVLLRCECPGGTAVGCTESCAGGARSGYLEVTVAQPVALLLPWPGIGAEARIVSSTVLRLY